MHRAVDACENPPHCRFSTVTDLLKKAFAEWSEDKASRLAASLAYYTAISIAPLLVLSVTVLSQLNLNGKEVVEGQLGALMGPVGEAAATQMIDSAKQQSGVLATVISLIVLLFGASGVFAELQDSMNTVWEVQPKPGLSWLDLIKARFFSLTMVFGVIFVLLVSLIISTILGALVTRFAGNGHLVGLVLDIVLSLIVYSGVFALLFRYLPDVKIGFRDVWLGAILTAVLFTIGKYLLTIYLTKGSTASTYGAAGSLAALLIWVYYSSQILFFGAEFTQVYARKYGSRIEPAEHAVPVTEERRAQQGIVREHDLATAAKAADAMADHRGGAFGAHEAVPQPRVVTITRPDMTAHQGDDRRRRGISGGVCRGRDWLVESRSHWRRCGGWTYTPLDAELNKRLDA